MDKVREQACQRALTSEHLAPVRGPSGLLEGLQCGVALEALGESGCSLGTEVVGRDAARMGAEARAEACQRALTQKRTLRAAVHLSEVTALPLRPSHSLVMPLVV